MSTKKCTTHHYACDCREAKHKADIDRKNKLLKDALEWLIACEFGVSLSVITDIEKELKGVSDGERN